MLNVPSGREVAFSPTGRSDPNGPIAAAAVNCNDTLPAGRPSGRVIVPLITAVEMRWSAKSRPVRS